MEGVIKPPVNTLEVLVLSIGGRAVTPEQPLPGENKTETKQKSPEGKVKEPLLGLGRWGTDHSHAGLPPK